MKLDYKKKHYILHYYTLQLILKFTLCTNDIYISLPIWNDQNNQFKRILIIEVKTLGTS